MSDDITITKPGVYDDIPEAVYHADPVPQGSISASGAKLMLEIPFNGCPAKYRHALDNPQAPKRQFDFGHVAHKLLLGKGADIVKIDFPDYKKKAAQEARDTARADGKTPVLLKEYEKAEAMAGALWKHPFAGQLFQNGESEQSLFWKDPEFDIWCRCRFDYLVTGGLIHPDYKTCESAAPDKITRAANDYGYWLQVAWYADALKALGICDRPKVVLVFQEKTAPYLVTVAEYTADAKGWGRIAARKAKELFAQCQESGEWPGYANEVITLDLPPYAETRLQKAHEKAEFQTHYRPVETAAE